jgi:hypothetical protein
MLLLVIAWYSVGMTNNSKILVAGYEDPTRLEEILSCSTKDHELVQGFLDNALLWASDGLLVHYSTFHGASLYELRALPAISDVGCLGRQSMGAFCPMSTIYGINRLVKGEESRTHS